MLLSNMCMLEYGHGWAGEFRGALGVAEGLSMMCLCHISTAFLGTNTQPLCEAFECCQGKPIRDSVGTKVRLNCLGFFVFCFLFFCFFVFLVWHIQKPETGHCFVFLVLGKKTKITNLFAVLFVQTNQIYHSIFRFHWWVGLRHTIASDLLVCSINYICAVLFKIKVLASQPLDSSMLTQIATDRRDETMLWSQTILILAAMAFSLIIASLCSYRAVPHMILFYDLQWQ